MKGITLLVFLSLVAAATATLTFSDKSTIYALPQGGLGFGPYFDLAADPTSWFPKKAALSLTPQLFISGFVSAKGVKALALHNPSSQPVKTNRYSLRITPKGKTLGEGIQIQLQPAVVKPKSTYILALKGNVPANLAKAGVPLQSKKYQGKLDKFFQRDSVFALFVGKGLVDIIGTPGPYSENTGSQPGLVRLPSVISGNAGLFSANEWKGVSAQAWQSWSKHKVVANSKPVVRRLIKPVQHLAIEAMVPLEKGVYDVEFRLRFTANAKKFPLIAHLIGRNLKTGFKLDIPVEKQANGWTSFKFSGVTCYGKHRAAFTLKRYTVFNPKNQYVGLVIDWIKATKTGDVPKGASLDITSPFPNEKFQPGSNPVLTYQSEEKPEDSQVVVYIDGKEAGKAEKGQFPLSSAPGRHCVTVQIQDDDEVLASDFVCYKIYKKPSEKKTAGKKTSTSSKKGDDDDDSNGSSASDDDNDYKEGDGVTVTAVDFTTLSVSWDFSGNADVYIAKQNDDKTLGAWSKIASDASKPYSAQNLKAATIYHFAVKGSSGSFVLGNGKTKGLVRKDTRHLSSEERQAFIEALFYLNNNGDYLIQSLRHSLAFSPRFNVRGENPAHGGPIFLPWHRYFILDIETQINKYLANVKQTDVRVGFPYWRWSARRDSSLWNIFTDDFIGSTLNGYVNSGQFVKCTKSNVGKCWKTIAPLVTENVLTTSPNLDPNGLSRDVQTDSWDNDLPSDSQVAAALKKMKTYDEMVGEVEGWHNTVHMSVGGNFGDMGSGRSPNDPAFWLHHCNVDRLWATWQEINYPDYDPSSFSVPSGYPFTGTKNMWPWQSLATSINVTPVQMLNYNKLGFRYADTWTSGSGTPLSNVTPPSGGSGSGGSGGSSGSRGSGSDTKINPKPQTAKPKPTSRRWF